MTKYWSNLKAENKVAVRTVFNFINDYKDLQNNKVFH